MTSQIQNKFQELYQEKPLLVKSPGRINLIGEHTDYNDGFVLPASIDKSIFLAISKDNQGEKCQVFALDYNEEFDFSLSQISKPREHSWKNYIIGIIAEILKKDKNLQGFQAVFGGNIPSGAGLSSSAALENAFVFGLNELFKLGLSKNEMIKISQKAEHNFVGVQCGIMDQYTSMMGLKEKALLLDCRSLEAEEIELNLRNYELILINSNVKHSLADSAYNQRREECFEGVKVLQKYFPNITALRDANLEQIEAIKGEISETVYKRCTYIVEENMRVQKSKLALQKYQNLEAFGELLFEGHEGMQFKYEITCPEIDFLVEKAKENPNILGSRMMGGGFGGCTLNLIKKGTCQNFTEKLNEDYQKLFQKELSVYQVNIDDGVRTLGD